MLSNGAMLLKLSCLLAFVPTLVHSLAPTDQLQDADPAQSGYMPNHNIHPSIVTGWGQLWKQTFNAREQWYAKPLVYTPSGKSQVLVTASNMNIIRIMDAVTGAVLTNRTLQPPFLQADAACGDMANYIGVAGTPVIDPATDTVYMFSKGYKNGLAGPQGMPQGQYKFYALDVNTLADKPGFPIVIDGHFADNDPTRYFNGGTVLQRPSLVQLQGVVIGGFGGHCDQFNYTGMLVAVSKTPGVGITSMFATEASPGAPQPQPLDLTIQNGGRAAIWQSGMGLVADGNRIFFVTGNGQGHENGAVPASGRQPLSTLDECVTNMKVSSSGVLSLTDYFEPWEYVNLDAADRDFGAAGVALLDPVFNGTGASRIAVAAGKTGKFYVMNADNLGGFMQGAGGTDGVIQTLTFAGSVFGGPGSYPLEGGYVYFAPVGQPLLCYAFSRDANGNPQFTLAGQSAFINTGRAGVSVPTVTSYQGQAGTGIVWLTDVGVGLKAWNAVPVNGILTPIVVPALAASGKFIRPVFGDGIVYTSDSNGGFYAAGPGGPPPLNCSPKPLQFGSVVIGNTATQTITCTAAVAIPTVSGCYIADPHFKCLNSSLPTAPLALGATFSFPVTWDLTTATIGNTLGNPATVLPGTAGSTVHIGTSAISKYASDTTVNMLGTVVNSAAFLTVLPIHVDLGGITLGTGSTGLSSTFTITNTGNSPLTFTGFAWDDELANKVYNNITVSGSGATFGDGFSSSNFPTVGSTLAAGASLVVPVSFLTTTKGGVAIMITIWSTGGVSDVTLAGSAANPAVGVLSTAVNGGAYTSVQPFTMNFGTVNAQKSIFGNITICNPSTSGAQMTITQSVPPSDREVFAVAPNTDLLVGQKIPIGSCAMGRVEVSASFYNPNRPVHPASSTWTIATDGVNADSTPFSQTVSITGTIIPPQLGVIFPNGTARYQYLGCYFDGNGRQMAVQLSYNATQQANNENGQCQRDCFAAGWTFATTEYTVQCWCGNQPPLASKLATSDKVCNYACAGSTAQACGGPGTYASVYYDISKWSPPAAAVVSSSSVASKIQLVSSAPSIVATSVSSSAVLTSLSSSQSSSIVSTSPSSSTLVLSTSSILSSSSQSSVSSLASTSPSSSTLALTSTKLSTSALLSSSSVVSSSTVAISSSIVVSSSQITSKSSSLIPTSTALSTSSSILGSSSALTATSSSILLSSTTLSSSSSQLSTSTVLSTSSIPATTTILSSSSILSSSALVFPSSTILSTSSSVPATTTSLSSSSILSSSTILSSSSSVSSTVLSSSTKPVLSSSSSAFSSSTNPVIAFTSLPATTSVLSSNTMTSTSSSASSTPSKILPPGALVIPGATEVIAAPAGNFTDTLGNGGPLAGFVGYNFTVDAINPPTAMAGIYECLGNCSTSAFGGPYTVAGVEDTTCFCANNVSTPAVPGGGYFLHTANVASPSAGQIYIYTIVPISSLPDAPVAPPSFPSSTYLGSQPSSSVLFSSNFPTSSGSVAPSMVSSSSSSTVSSSSSIASPSSSIVSSSSSILSSSSIPILSSSSAISDTIIPSISAVASSLVPTAITTTTFISTSTVDIPTSSTFTATTSSGISSSVESSFLSSSTDLVDIGSSFISSIWTTSSVFSSTSDLPTLSTSSSLGPSPSSVVTSSSTSVFVSSAAGSTLGSSIITLLSSSTATSTSTAPTTTTSSILSNYQAIGCYSEPVVGRALTPGFFAADTMTLESCAASCAGYQYFGLEYARECYCGNSIIGGTPALSTDCNLPCMGNSIETCGGLGKLSVYISTSLVPILPAAPAAVSGYSYAGCQTEGPAGSRALSGFFLADYNLMTNELCAATCAAQGALMFGTEYGGECYCGDSLIHGSVPAPSTDCAIPCPGNSAEICGDRLRLTLFSKIVLSPSLSISSTAPSSTISSLKSSSSSSSTTSSIQPTIVSSSTTLSSTSFVRSTSFSSFRSSSIVKSSSTFMTTTSSSVPRITGFSGLVGGIDALTSYGCFKYAKPTETMTVLDKKAVNGMSPAICLSSAQAALLLPKPTTYLYIAVANQKTCLAATAAPSPVPTTLTGTKACTVPCKGNPGQICGGRSMYNLYAPTNVLTAGTPVVSKA